jgi:hypothetical protein
MNGTDIYTTKQIAEKLNLPVNKIYALKDKYKHLFSADYCVSTKIDGSNFLLWSDLGLSKLKELFLHDQEKKSAREWTKSQKQRQRELIQTWQPWQKSTGAKTEQGKARVSQNALKTGKHSAAVKLEHNEIKTQINKEIIELESKIIELQSRIKDLKINCKQLNKGANSRKHWMNARIEYESGDVTLQYLADMLGVSVRTVERRSIKESWRKNGIKNRATQPDLKPLQLNMMTLEDETDDSQEGTIYDRMRAYALENGIELKTMQFA